MALPIEATAIGNVMMQAYAAGRVSSLAEMRRMIARCVPTETFLPGNAQEWNAAYERFETLLAGAAAGGNKQFN